MAREKSPQRLRAYELYLESGGEKKLHLIAEEIGVSEATVRSWKKRDDWTATKQEEKCNDAKEKTATKRNANPPKKKTGAQPGNKNAVGNRGGKGNPAPPGNAYALVTGEYETIMFDTLSERERALIKDAPLAPKEMLLDQYRVAIVREHRCMQRIEAIKRLAERNMVPASVSIESYAHGEESASTTKKTRTTHENLDERLIRNEDALLRIQEFIRKVSLQLHKYNYDSQRLDLDKARILALPTHSRDDHEDETDEDIDFEYDYGGDDDA